MKTMLNLYKLADEPDQSLLNLPILCKGSLDKLCVFGQDRYGSYGSTYLNQVHAAISLVAAFQVNRKAANDDFT